MAKKTTAKKRPFVDDIDVEEVAQRVLKAIPGDSLSDAELRADIAKKVATFSGYGLFARIPDSWRERSIGAFFGPSQQATANTSRAH